MFDGTSIFQGHHSTAIRELDLAGNLLNTFPQSQVVGMAIINGTFWISKWSPQLVGTWDPGANRFTPVFSSPANAGGLAWDGDSNVLWVGLQGGSVVPYTLAGVALNAGFKPFGNIGNTVDGLAFFASVPEPSSAILLGVGVLAIGIRRRKELLK